MIQSDDRLIVALDVPDALAGLELAARLGDSVSFYKIGLGMLTGGGFALASELKQDHGKRIFLDMKLFDIGATIEAATRGLARSGIDFLTVHGDPHVVRAACEGAAGSPMRVLAVTFLTSLDRSDLDAAQTGRERLPISWPSGPDGHSRPEPTASLPRPSKSVRSARCPKPMASWSSRPECGRAARIPATK